MKCTNCGNNWMHWRNLGKLNAYLYCPDCGKEKYPPQAEEELPEITDEDIEKFIPTEEEDESDEMH